MNNQDNIRGRLNSPEDQFVERKSEGVSYEDICKTLVAFANSLPRGQEAILFIGVSDKGGLTGVSDTDKMQKHIVNLAQNRCYPPVQVQCQVVNISEVNVVAATVFPSTNKPHFAGPAFVRVGTESKKASEKIFEELITSRNDKGRLILEYRDKDSEVLIDFPSPWIPNEKFRVRCKVIDCNPYFATFRGIADGQEHSVSLEAATIKWEGAMNMPLITERKA